MTIRTAKEFTDVIQTRKLIVEKSLWISLMSIVFVMLMGYVFSGYILRPIRLMNQSAQRFSLENKDDEHTIDVAGNPRDDVVILARSLESLFARVRHDASRLEQFSDDIAHEIKNKLFSIESSLDIALHTDHTHLGISRAKNMIGELSSVVDALLFFSRNESQIQEEVDVGEYIRTHIDMSDARVSVTQESVVKRSLYPELFITAVGNIISNAQKFTPEDGKISIHILTDGIDIQDTGVGISPENLPRVFDRLWKSDVARVQGSGHGLGLAIAKKIIEELHGMQLSVKSKEGK